MDMIDDKTKQALSLWEKLSQTYEALRKTQVKAVFEHKLTGPQFNVLEVLYVYGPMPLKKIGERLFVSGANITCVVDNLEKEGFVKRVPSNEDRRIIIAELTEKGRSKMENVFPIHAKNITSITNALSEEEQHDLEKLLKKLDVKNSAA